MPEGHTSTNLISNLNFVLRRFHYILLDQICSIQRLSLRRSKTFRIAALTSSFALILLTAAVLIPIYNNISITEAATSYSASTLSMNVTNGTASVDLGVVKDNGSFSSSINPVAFNITTNNYTGYTLSIKSGKNDTALVNESNSSYTLSSIASSISPTTFSEDSATAADNYNGKWGYMPSKYNSVANSSYLPAPTTTASTLDKTTAANSSANSYTIAIGARASYTQAAGAYTGTYILAAIGNAVAYNISFADNTNDSTVANLPDALAGSVSATSITLPTAIPTRTGYTFKSWCSTAPTSSGTTCSGDSYSSGSTFYLNEATGNVGILYATWTVNSYTQTVEYYCQSATGAASSKYTYTQSVNYGSTFTFTSNNATSCYNSTYHSSTIYTANNGTTSKTISYKVTGASTNTAYFNRNTRTVNLTKSTGINTVSVTGTGVKSGSGTASATVYYGGAVTITATMTSGYDWVNWTGSTTYTSQSQSISSVTSNLSFTGNGKASVITIANGSSTTMQSISSKADGGCPSSLPTGTAYTLTDNRDGQTYQVARLKDGNCWLLDNLALGAVELKETLSINNTNMSSRPFSLPSSSDKIDSYTVAQINTSYYISTQSYGSGNGKIGVYYNYCAVSAGTICGDSNSSNASYDICPKGWRMPTSNGSSSSEYQALYTAYSSNAMSLKNALRTPLAGTYTTSVAYQGSRGYFWGSSYSDTFFMSTLVVTASSAGAGNEANRTLGASVRCVLK